MSEQMIMDKRVARLLLGYFIEGEYKEVVQIEYRYTPCGQHAEFEIYTRIKGQEYHFQDSYFISALAALLDQLPLTSGIMIPHQVPLLRHDVIEIVTLEEWLYPYESRDKDTIVYQLKLLVDNYAIETPRHHHGYLVTDFELAAELLRIALGNEFQLGVCYFCRYLALYERNGGTDGRHDLLHCFRDRFPGAPESLEEVLKSYRTLLSREPLMAEGTPDMNALHSCSTFVYRETQL